MSNEPTIDRLSAYLDDELSPDEREGLEEQLASSESLREQLEKLRQVRDWFRDYPGRKPQSDAWQGIVARVSATGAASGTDWPEERKSRRHWVGGLAFWPAFASAGMSTAFKRIGIGVLIAVALGGMGRQYVLEQRADNLEHTNVLRDIQLIRYASAARWSATASNLRGEVGRRLSFVCPPGGEPRAIWGTGTYTDDSGICTAGVHSGVITFEDGGLVNIEVLPGLREYRGSEHNGIQSRGFGAWQGSFAIVGEAEPSKMLPHLDGGTTSWSASAIDFRGLNGSSILFSCPADGEPEAVWGSGPYTDDSSICTAAVHTGVITFRRGGPVMVEIVPGQTEYNGTSQNGVESHDFPEWPGSFVVVPSGVPGDSPHVAPRPRPDPRAVVRPYVDVRPRVLYVAPDVRVAMDTAVALTYSVSVSLGDIDWSSTAMEMGDWTGTQTELTCPPNGSEEPVWGTDTYTDGSSICTAAVHAGLITFEDGGTVNIEIRPGQSSYPGSSRNGVATRTFRTSDAWRRSFGFVSN
jgi:phage baseplate assembly protein gpV